MVEKGISVGICHAINWYVKANKKNMKDYDKNTEPLHLKNLDVNNMHGWAMPQKLPFGGFK